MRKIKLLIIVFAVFALSAACFKIEPISVIPNIEFISFEIFDTTDILQNSSKGGKLKFKFEDGDGDVGLYPLIVADSTNLEMTLYRKTNGVMQHVTDTTDPLLPASAYRIPYMDRVGQSKVQKGEIIISIIYQSYNQDDIIKYSFFITDRAGNVSNTEETVEIIVAQNGIYKKQ
jgi:hypothetical protein